MKRLQYPVMGFLWLAFAALLCASESEPGPFGKKAKLITEYDLPGLDKRISIDLQEPMSIEDFVKFLALKGGLNIVIGKGVEGSTKLMLEDVAVGDALEIVLAANDLAYEVKGNILKIMTGNEYKERYGESFYEQRQVKIIQLKYADPESVAKMLEQVKSTIGKIVADKTTGTLVLIDTPERIKAMETVVHKE